MEKVLRWLKTAAGEQKEGAGNGSHDMLKRYRSCKASKCINPGCRNAFAHHPPLHDVPPTQGHLGWHLYSLLGFLLVRAATFLQPRFGQQCWGEIQSSRYFLLPLRSKESLQRNILNLSLERSKKTGGAKEVYFKFITSSLQFHLPTLGSVRLLRNRLTVSGDLLNSIQRGWQKWLSASSRLLSSVNWF